MEYDILLSICKNDDIASLERIVMNHKVDGVILMRTFVEDKQIAYLQSRNVPFVTIGSTLLYLNLDNNVVIDRTVEEVLDRKADCILCMDDAICSRVLKRLREKQVSVPKDIRVASFYNSMVLDNNVPSITSLDFDSKELGMVACKTLLDLIEGVNVETRTLLPYEVVLKESTK